MSSNKRKTINKPGSPWAVKDEQAVEEASEVVGLKHGLFCHVPIICRENDCPYVETCFMDPQDRVFGERCPIEMAAITTRFESYCKSLFIDDDSTVDLSLVKELVDIEVQILRADSLLAISGNFIEDVVVGVDPRGRTYTKPELHRALDAKNSLRQSRHKILTLLNSTRKDRSVEITKDPSTAAAELVAKAARLLKAGKLKDPDDINGGDNNGNHRS